MGADASSSGRSEALRGAIAAFTFLAAIACGSTGDDSPDQDCELGSSTDCSVCGDACPAAAPLCAPAGAGFECVAQCGTDLTECDGRCVSTDSDARHCGGCDSPCAFPNGIPACVGGVCALDGCADPFGDCNSSESDGCETPINSDSDCGMCGNTCDADDRCIDSACNPCPATEPTVTGGHGNNIVCKVEASGNQLRNITDPGPDDGCDDEISVLSFSDVTVSGSTSSGTICKISASGNQITYFTRDDTTCDLEMGVITVTGATVSGGMTGNPCGVMATGNTIQFFVRDDAQCTDPGGTIVLSPVCL